ncbi:hypothetical protein AGMMS4957_04930 [Bacteroidia bacterium]|nr:hypothetical protein AGMMS4957_04930 [Bacteroidia bacterium]
MEAISVEIVNPKAKKLLQNLVELNLIQIVPRTELSDMLAKLRRNASEVPSLEEITAEVETVRQIRYARKTY